MNEKWVVVDVAHDWETVFDVHGIFDSKHEAQTWADNQYFVSEVRRIRKAVVDEWA